MLTISVPPGGGGKYTTRKKGTLFSGGNFAAGERTESDSSRNRAPTAVQDFQ